nr:PP2C family protein-serine/threonine phosphatase [Streptomyces sp. 3212.3]
MAPDAPRTFATDRILISAVMEPAYEVSGDAFDYALAGDTLHMAVFDAMGHDTAAGLTANLALATCRSFRREGADLLRTADGIEEALAEQFRGGRFATGILASLNTTTGVCTWISCGHYPPVIVRGRRTIVHLSCAPSPPLGTELGLSASVCREQLEPGDRLLLYTDGVTEARNADGQEFGLEGLTDFLIRHNTDDLPVPETLRRLVRHHLDYHRGKLNDDATILLLEWHGPAPFRPESLESLVGLPPPHPPASLWHHPDRSQREDPRGYRGVHRDSAQSARRARTELRAREFDRSIGGRACSASRRVPRLDRVRPALRAESHPRCSSRWSGPGPGPRCQYVQAWRGTVWPISAMVLEI